jgi:hypothetical protein
VFSVKKGAGSFSFKELKEKNVGLQCTTAQYIKCKRIIQMLQLFLCVLKPLTVYHNYDTLMCCDMRCILYWFEDTSSEILAHINILSLA